MVGSQQDAVGVQRLQTGQQQGEVRRAIAIRIAADQLVVGLRLAAQ